MRNRLYPPSAGRFAPRLQLSYWPAPYSAWAAADGAEQLVSSYPSVQVIPNASEGLY